MKPIDGDRLKEILDNTEDLVVNSNRCDLPEKYWEVCIDALKITFKIVRDVIDELPALTETMDYLDDGR